MVIFHSYVSLPEGTSYWHIFASYVYWAKLTRNPWSKRNTEDSCRYGGSPIFSKCTGFQNQVPQPGVKTIGWFEASPRNSWLDQVWVIAMGAIYKPSPNSSFMALGLAKRREIWRMGSPKFSPKKPWLKPLQSSMEFQFQVETSNLKTLWTCGQNPIKSQKNMVKIPGIPHFKSHKFRGKRWVARWKAMARPLWSRHDPGLGNQREFMGGGVYGTLMVL